MDEEGELHQYVIYEQTKPKGPKIIKLDDPKRKNAEMENYTPPTSLTVHLSKIDMPELKPRTIGQGTPDKKGKGKEGEKKKEKEKPAKKDKRNKPSPSPPPTKPGKSPSPGHPNPPSIPDHTRPPANMWVQHLPQESGALNTATPQPQQPTSMVSNLMGRLDRFAKR